MDDTELLRAVYRAIAWKKLCRHSPEVSREQVDDLFRRLGELIKRWGEPASAAPSPAPPSAQAPGRPGLVRLYCDGASSGNPGPAGVGMVLCDSGGTEIQAWGGPLRRATNNVAEYSALIEGLRRALELDVREIEVNSDSQLLVFQLTGRYKVRSAALADLHREALALLRRFDSWHVQHIPRSQNRRADGLATRYARRGKNTRATLTPPPAGPKEG